MQSTGKERDAVGVEIDAARARGQLGRNDYSLGVTMEQLISNCVISKAMRVRLYVDAKDVARLEFLNNDGKLIAGYPSAESRE